MLNKSFSASFPKNCPPNDAVSANGNFYRLVESVPPDQKDFKTYAELGRKKDGDACLRCGLSVFPTEDDAVTHFRHMKQSYPNLGLGELVAKLSLTHNDGVVKQTRKPPHHTWWPYQGTNRLSTYAEIVKDFSSNVGS